MAAGAALLLLLAHADDALRLEDRAALVAARPVRQAAGDLFRWSAREWVTRHGGLRAVIDPIEWAAFQPDVVQRLTRRRPDPASTVLDFARRGYALGVRQASRVLGLTGMVDGSLSERLHRQAEATATTVKHRYDRAGRMLGSTEVATFDDLTAALAPVHAAVQDVDRDTRTVVNAAVNQASQDLAAEHGADLIWVSEVDACLTCLALAGQVVGHHEPFDVKATFVGTGLHRPTAPWVGPQPLRPPRHPRCRCRAEAYLGHQGAGISLPDLLRREAQRAVLAGWAGDSEPQRLRAADRLLQRGAIPLPQRVQARARRAVAAGHFGGVARPPALPARITPRP